MPRLTFQKQQVWQHHPTAITMIAKVWPCPHLSMNFHQAKEMSSKIPASRTSSRQCLNGAVCERIACSTNLAHALSASEDQSGRLSYELISVALFWTPRSRHSPATYQRIFPSARIATALRGLEFLIFPHLRLNQSFSLNRYGAARHLCRSPSTEPCHGIALFDGTVALNAYRDRRYRPSYQDQGLTTSFSICVLSYAYENGEEEFVLGLDFRRNLGNL
jgi:hypothetical protein